MVGGKAAAEAGAMTHGAVRCSAWLGVGSLAFGVEVRSVAVTNRDVVPKKELTERLTPSIWCELYAAAGNFDLLAGKTHRKGGLALPGTDNDDSVMGDKA
jgi:hypothetical protein